MIRLRITGGPAAGQTVEAAGEIVFGRAQPGQGALGGDPDVSRRHARIAPGAGGWVVDDLGSTNGTFVGSERVAGTRLLAAGDQITMGGSRLEVVAVESEATTEPPRTVPLPPPA